VGGGLARVSATAMWSASAPIGRSVARLPKGSALESQGVDTDERLSKGRTEFDEQAHINIGEAEDARITRNSQSVIHRLDAHLRKGGQRLAGNDWGPTIGWKSLSSGCLANGTCETVATTSHISHLTVSSSESESSRLRDQVIPCSGYSSLVAMMKCRKAEPPISTYVYTPELSRRRGPSEEVIRFLEHTLSHRIFWDQQYSHFGVFPSVYSTTVIN